MKILSVLLSGLLVASTQAASLPVDTGNVIRRNALGTRWEKRDALDSNAKIPVRIALKQQNLDKGMDYLMEVSDPASPKYGQHYTPDQVIELFAPKDDTIQLVKQWLVRNGVSPKSIKSPKSKGWLDFTTTVGRLEKILNAKYSVFSQAGKGSHIASEEYTIPDEISGHVDFIEPASSFSEKAAPAVGSEKRTSPSNVKPFPIRFEPVGQQRVKQLKVSSESENYQYCSTYVTPQCIRAFYKIPEGNSSISGNRLGIYEADDEFPQQSDLTQFYALFAPNIPSTFGPQIDLINFGSCRPNPKNSSGEAALDFDMAQPLIYPQETVLFQSKDNFDSRNGPYGIFNQFLDAIDGTYCTKSSHNQTGDDPVVDGPSPNQQCGVFEPTNVISFSYLWSEYDYPAGYLERQCDEFMKLGLQGTTLVFASGDGGVAGGHGADCLGINGGFVFNPLVGAACPYVTTVGSTQIASGDQPGDSELATTRFGSGGGFSNIWSTPDYQQSAVSSFFSNYDPGFDFYTTSNNVIPSLSDIQGGKQEYNGKGLYNRAGRGYPDLAAYGDYGVIVFNGKVGRIGGTSMSTPIVASIFARINEERLAAGKSVIGFANPALYANPKMFNDVTIGDQKSEGSGACQGKSFKAVPGWDPVSGLGTPDYPAFLEYFLSLY